MTNEAEILLFKKNYILYSDQMFIAILRAHDFSQSSRVLKLFALPWHPP